MSNKTNPSNKAPLVIVFDVETTGLDPQRDQVIELSLQISNNQVGANNDQLIVGDRATEKTWRIKPSVPISPASQAVHGISIEDLANCPSFAECGAEIRTLFASASVLVAYNLRFDLDFLQSELKRNNLPLLDTGTIQLIDPYQIWRKCEPRSLSDAHRRFVGTELTGAHGATADTQACAKVLQGMIEHFSLKNKTLAELADISGVTNKNWIGPSYHFCWQEGVPVFGFGKHKGRPVIEVAAEDNGSYFDWLAAKDFPDHVKEISKIAPKASAEELNSWLNSKFS